MQAINFKEIRHGFQGSPFCKLVQHHLSRQNQKKRIRGIQGTVEMLPDKAKPLVEQFIDRWNVRAYEKDFWQMDTAAVFDEIIEDARNVLFESGISYDDETLFNMFNIIVLSYAYSAYDQPKMREFIGIASTGEADGRKDKAKKPLRAKVKPPIAHKKEPKKADGKQISQAMVILRWIAFLPGASLTAWFAWFIVALLNRITMAMSGLDPNSFLSKVFIEFISHAVMGAAFVYAGAKMAPFHNKIIAYALAGVGLIASGFMLFPAIMVANYWAVLGGVSLILGCGVTAYSVFTGETDL